jgi:putative membrane protein
MRLIKSLIALMFIGLGVVFGALHRQVVHLDLWYWEFDVRLGLTLIVVLLVGALLGGLVVTAGVVWPLRRQMRRTGNAQSGPDLSLPAPGDSP